MTKPSFPQFKNKEAAIAFIRKVMGPPKATLDGKQKSDILLLIAMMEPFRATNNQHSFTEYYRIGDTEYHVTTFPDGDIVVDKMLKDD